MHDLCHCTSHLLFQCKATRYLTVSWRVAVSKGETTEADPLSTGICTNTPAHMCKCPLQHRPPVMVGRKQKQHLASSSRMYIYNYILNCFWKSYVVHILRSQVSTGIGLHAKCSKAGSVFLYCPALHCIIPVWNALLLPEPAQLCLRLAQLCSQLLVCSLPQWLKAYIMQMC